MTLQSHEGNQTVVRAFELLAAYSNGDKELGVRELSRRMNLPKSTVFRLIASLQSVGALEKNPATDKYYLGLRLFELGSLVAMQRGFQERVHGRLESLVARSGETAHLAVFDKEGYAVVVDKVASPRAVTVSGPIGVRRPLYCSAIGKSLIAFLPEPERKHVLNLIFFERRTSHTIVTPDALERELSRVRELGYSVDNEEFEDGLRCLAAPIFNPRREVIAAIGISGPSQRLNADSMPYFAQMLKDEAGLISREWGHSQFTADSFEPR